MSVVFIIPVKSPGNSNSWERCSSLFERCIRSVCQQTDRDFRVVVVCNEKPLTKFEHANIRYCYVNFPDPTVGSAATAVCPTIEDDTRRALRKDKLKKILAGLEYAEQFEKTHIMVVDADDCISSNIVAFVKKHPDVKGWFMNSGHVYIEGSKLIFKKVREFNLLCGTCAIVQPHLLKSMFTPKKYDHAMTALDKGVTLTRLPFVGAVYTVGNGENIRMTKKTVGHLMKDPSLGFLGFARRIVIYRVWFLTNRIAKRFGLYPIP